LRDHDCLFLWYELIFFPLNPKLLSTQISNNLVAFPSIWLLGIKWLANQCHMSAPVNSSWLFLWQSYNITIAMPRIPLLIECHHLTSSTLPCTYFYSFWYLDSLPASYSEVCSIAMNDQKAHDKCWNFLHRFISHSNDELSQGGRESIKWSIHCDIPVLLKL
jgi:hypothetical protein